MTDETSKEEIALEHPTLGRLVFDERGEAMTSLPFEEGEVTINVTFTNQAVNAEVLEQPGRRCSDLVTVDREARRVMLADFANEEQRKGPQMRQYKSDIFDNVDVTALTQCFGTDNPAQVDDERFIAGLGLESVWIFATPDPDDSALACWYLPRHAQTNRFLIVNLGREGERSLGMFTYSDQPISESEVTEVMTHPTLGHLEFREFDNSLTADTTLMLGEIAVPLDIWFPKRRPPTAEEMAESGQRVSDLAKLDMDARKAIAEDLARGEDGQTVHLYKTHHFEELDAATLAERFGVAELAQIDDARFVAGLQLRRVGLYPKEPDETFVCDYTVGADLTDYIIAVKVDNRGRVRSVDMES
jgi:hypothetical protein